MWRQFCIRADSKDYVDNLQWERELTGHEYGEYSIAAAQANETMEDQSHLLNSKFGTFVGVYDGHGGPQVACFIKDNIYNHIHKFASEEGGISAEVLRKSIKATEDEFLKLATEKEGELSCIGSSCIVGFVTNKNLYVANVGDCRAVLGVYTMANGKKKPLIKSERLSKDHSASEEEIRDELQKLHPDDPTIVILKDDCWRVKGVIEVSRSIGDLYFKKPWLNADLIFSSSPPKPILTAEPYIHVRELKSEDSFLIFASDGLWKYVSDQEAVDIVNNNPRKSIAKRLVRAALEEAAKKQRGLKYGDLTKLEKGVRRDFHDDITVIVIFLDHEHEHGVAKSKIKAARKIVVDSTSVPEDIFSHGVCSN